MDYQVSARKYRPQTFAEVIGQPHVVQTLQNAIQGNRIAHAYVFSGMRGVGKTTVARILAKSLNCERGPTIHPCGECPSCLEISTGQSVDVIEIDGASNTGVDDVRELRENVKYTPFRGGYRIYIIDEVHMLSTSAFNALLKTLEEPPPHVVFVFATTEVHKIPATILSRCQHFTFRRIPRQEMLRQLRHIAAQRDVDIEDRSLSAIVRASEGSMRDALSLLDQAIAFGGKTIRYSDVEGLLGSIPDELVRQLINAILARNAPQGITCVNDAIDQGYDARILCREVVEQLRNLMIAALAPSHEQLDRLLELPAEEIDTVRAQAQQVGESMLYECFMIFLRTAEALRGSAFTRFLLEAAVVRATQGPSTSGSSQEYREQPLAPSSRPALRPVSANQDAKPAQPIPPSLKRSGNRVHLSPRTQSGRPPDSTLEYAKSSTHSGGESMASPGTQSHQSVDASATEQRDPQPKAPLQWETVMDHVLNEHPNIGAFLGRGRIITAGPDEVVIGFSKQDSTARTMVDKPETRKLLTEICTQTAGRSVTVKIVETAEHHARTPTIAQQTQQRQRQEEQDLMAQAQAHPLVKRALELFGGTIVSATRHSPKEVS